MKIPALIIALFVSHSLYAQTYTQIWSPKTPSNLKQFSLRSEIKAISFDSTVPKDVFTDVRFSYTVNKPEGVLDYGIVQFIRGCMFESYKDKNQVKRYVNVQRFHMGKYKKFLHKDWALDTFTFDPLYTSYKDDRFESLRWNLEEDDLTTTKAKRVSADGLPPHGRVFDSDLPGQASVIRNQFDGKLYAKNPSLEFKACLFRLSDLPEKTDENLKGVDMERALHCFDWQHNYEYNFETKEIEEKTQIAKVCRQ